MALRWIEPNSGNRNALWVLWIKRQQLKIRERWACNCELGLKNGEFRRKRRILQVGFMVDLVRYLIAFMAKGMNSCFDCKGRKDRR